MLILFSLLFWVCSVGRSFNANLSCSSPCDLNVFSSFMQGRDGQLVPGIGDTISIIATASTQSCPLFVVRGPVALSWTSLFIDSSSACFIQGSFFLLSSFCSHVTKVVINSSLTISSEVTVRGNSVLAVEESAVLSVILTVTVDQFAYLRGIGRIVAASVELTDARISPSGYFEFYSHCSLCFKDFVYGTKAGNLTIESRNVHFLRSAVLVWSQNDGLQIFGAFTWTESQFFFNSPVARLLVDQGTRRFVFWDKLAAFIPATRPLIRPDEFLPGCCSFEISDPVFSTCSFNVSVASTLAVTMIKPASCSEDLTCTDTTCLSGSCFTSATGVRCQCPSSNGFTYIGVFCEKPVCPFDCSGAGNGLCILGDGQDSPPTCRCSRYLERNQFFFFYSICFCFLF